MNAQWSVLPQNGERQVSATTAIGKATLPDNNQPFADISSPDGSFAAVAVIRATTKSARHTGR
ncbi:hypothetical protein ACO1NJ_14425, partial [Staphylococcus aureus]